MRQPFQFHGASADGFVRALVPAALTMCVLLLGARSAAGSQAITANQSGVVVRQGQSNATIFDVTITNNNTGVLGLGANVTLTGITFTNLTAGPGTAAQRDAELGSPRLYLDDGDGVPEPAQDSQRGQASATAGKVTFGSLNLNIPGYGGSVRFFVITDVPVSARDGDALDLSINASSDVAFSSGQTYSTAFPVSPVGSFPVDGMIAARITTRPVGGSVIAGTTNRLALDVTLPPNSYTTDVLEKIAVDDSLGSARVGSEITAVRAFADNGSGVFDPATDAAIGTLVYTGDRWQLSGLAVGVPAAGLRVFVAVDVSDLAEEGRTIRLRIPGPPDAGIGMSSGDDGPIDVAIPNPSSLAISTADRIAWTTTILGPGIAVPGQRAIPLAQWSVNNRYSDTRLLDQLTTTVLVSGTGTQAERDDEIEQLALRVDTNGNATLDPADAVLATAPVINGRATFTGFSYSLPAGATRTLFVAADVSAAHATDGDTLGLKLAGPSDVAFEGATRSVGAWPLDSGGRRVVNGMAAASIQRFAVPGGTLGRNDGPVLAFDAIVPRNGYRDDVLQGVRLVNLGTAGPADVAAVHLWHDGGDGVFSAGGGDDEDLGAATWQSGAWVSGPLNVPLRATGARIFAAATISATPTGAATLRLAIPVGGVTVASANDGPVDDSVDSPNGYLLSDSPLLAGLQITPGASTLGQTVTLRMIVRDGGADSILSIMPSSPVASGTGALTFVSGPVPASLSLAPGEEDTLTWTWTAASAGDVRFTAHATGTESPGGTSRPSLDATSNTHTVFQDAGVLSVGVAATLPGSVNRGQAGVGVMNLTLTSGGGSQSASTKVTRVRLHLQDGTGAGIVPASLLTRATVSDGGTQLLDQTSPEGTGSDLDLTLATPVIVPPSTQVTLTIRFSIAAATTVSNFRAAIVDAGSLTAEDANSGAPVTVQLLGTPPIVTGLARVVEGATRVEVASADTTAMPVGRGQHGVTLLTLRLTSPGQDAITSDVLVNSVVLELRDTTQALVARPSDVLERVRVRAGTQVLAVRSLAPSDGPSLTLLLSPALVVPVNTPVDVAIEGDIAAAAATGTFFMACGDTSTFDAEDRNTRDRVPAAYAGDPLGGRRFTVERAADTLRVSGVAAFAPSVVIGATEVPVMRIRLAHPGSPGTARIRVDSLTFVFGNGARQPLVPSEELSRLHVAWNGTMVADLGNPPATGSAWTAPLPSPELAPADSAWIDVSADVAPAAAEGSLELRVFAGGIFAVDADLGTPLVLEPPSPTDLPLSSGLTSLVSPARDLFVALTGALPAALAGDGSWTPLGTLTLRNGGNPSSGAIRVDRLALRAADRDLAPVAAGAAITDLAATIGGTPWAENATFTADSALAVLRPAAPLDVPAGATVTITLAARLRTGREGTSLRVGFDGTGIGVVQPQSALLQVAVRPEPGQAFPLWTEAGSFASLTLAGSWSNYPNPFAAGREATTFAYWLARPARVSLRIVTLGGESVARVLDAAPRPAGMQSGDRWDGRNGAGLVVRNGVYVAELTAVYADGRTERTIRKVAVVR